MRWRALVFAYIFFAGRANSIIDHLAAKILSPQVQTTFYIF